MEREGVGEVNGEVDGGGGRKWSEVDREGGKGGGRRREGERKGGREECVGAHHSFAVFTDGCTNESVLNKIVCESFSEKKIE